MAEIQFLNGTFVVDKPLVGPIMEVTDGSPERFSFQEAMNKIGNWQTKQYLRQSATAIIRDHLRIHGSHH